MPYLQHILQTLALCLWTNQREREMRKEFPVPPILFYRSKFLLVSPNVQYCPGYTQITPNTMVFEERDLLF